MTICRFTQHEQASVNMFRHLLEKNQQVRNEFERWNLSIKEHGKFIEELIVGEPDESSPLVSELIIAQPLHLLANHSVLHIF